MVNLKSIVGDATVLPESKQMTSFGLAPHKKGSRLSAPVSRGQSTEAPDLKGVASHLPAAANSHV